MQTIKLIEDNTGKNLPDLGYSGVLLYVPKIQFTEKC